MTKRVLFVCTGNSIRSIIAEAILRRAGKGRFEAHSAGTEPAEMVSPFALAALGRRGYPQDGLRSKSWREFVGADAPAFDYLIAVSSQARDEMADLWPGGGEHLYWPVTDPTLVEGNQSRFEASFDVARDTIESYVTAFVDREGRA